MPPGRPPKPTEVKRRNGNPGCRPLPDVSTVSVLPMATQPPEPPAELGVEGRRLWDRCWDAAITWLSPISDVDAVVQVCHLVDDVAQARRWYREDGSTHDLHALIAAQKRCCTPRCPASGSTRPVGPSSAWPRVRRVAALEDLMSRLAR